MCWNKGPMKWYYSMWSDEIRSTDLWGCTAFFSVLYIQNSTFCLLAPMIISLPSFHWLLVPLSLHSPSPPYPGPLPPSPSATLPPFAPSTPSSYPPTFQDQTPDLGWQGLLQNLQEVTKKIHLLNLWFYVSPLVLCFSFPGFFTDLICHLQYIVWVSWQLLYQ